ncbi:hypothetical protein L1085_009625 [Streptomyces sp. MSC1_001]|jgi:hypothetical protein|uniref:hypothetical protein n=1 Tax=Streptomyces sp. MSC1_001 TaxID=2909263 RepID=UPI0020302B26|nr:hypothetical protein [Streptomyces sp. MSC1_001]
MTSEPYPWVRRDTERGRAYDAFQAYLRLGPRRTITEAADAVGISRDSAADLSRRHDWVARSVAYDQHLATAATDGIADQMASARDEDLELAGQMRGYALSMLQEFMLGRAIPPSNYSQFVLAMIRLEEHAFRLKDDPKTSAARDKAKELLDRLDRANRS